MPCFRVIIIIKSMSLFRNSGTDCFVIFVQICSNEVFHRFGSRFPLGKFDGANRVHYPGQWGDRVVRGKVVVSQELPNQENVTVQFDLWVRDEIAFVGNFESPDAGRVCIKKCPACHENDKVYPHYGREGRVGHVVSSPCSMSKIQRYTMGYVSAVYSKLWLVHYGTVDKC